MSENIEKIEIIEKSEKSEKSGKVEKVEIVKKVKKLKKVKKVLTLIGHEAARRKDTRKQAYLAVFGIVYGITENTAHSFI